MPKPPGRPRRVTISDRNMAARKLRESLARRKDNPILPESTRKNLDQLARDVMKTTQGEADRERAKVKAARERNRK